MRRLRHIKTFDRVVYALLSGAWLFAFMPLLAKLGFVHGATSFIPVIAFLALAMFFPWWWTRVAGGVVASFVYVTIFWRPHGQSFVVGLVHMPATLGLQLAGLLKSQPFADPLQTFLFVWLITVVYWLVAYASRRMRTWAFYNVLALAVLAAIDGNTNIHPNASMVVITAIFFTVLGLNQLAHIRFFASKDTRPAARFLAPLAVLMAVSLLVAFALPKQAAAWPNPFGAGSNGTGTTIQSIGYQLDNSRLGGSFTNSDSEVLDVLSPYPTYLRGQTLSTYTGKGWKSAPLTGAQMTEHQTNVPIDNRQDYTFHGLPTQTFDETIQLRSNNVNTTDLLVGYAVNDVLQLPGLYQNQFAVDDLQGNIKSSQLHSGQSYRVQVTELRDPYTILSAKKTAFSSLSSQIPEQIKQTDLQLPAELPRRVGALAESIVNGAKAKTEYDMVTAIEAYLQTNATYQTYDIPVPGKRQDYVDQFLFDSKRGYCNNFSSSLAVMLRTLHVPTRWVTGFTNGTQDFNYTDKVNNRYVVSNNDAHSWVEVYFPQYGWIPFDPTPNFQIPFSASAANPSSYPNTPVTPPASKGSVKHPTPPRSHEASPSGGSNFFTWWNGLRIALAVLGGMVLAAIVLAVANRRRFLVYRLHRKWAKNPSRTFEQAYALLLRLLRRRYGLSNELTVRELWPYAARAGIGEKEYQAWVQTAERMLYGGKPPGADALLQLQSLSMRWLHLITHKGHN